MRCAGLALIALLSVACRASGDRPGLVIVSPVGPFALTPNQSTEELTASILGNVYETLVRFGPELHLEPELAESWHNPDDLTWVFQLRDGIRLHDGRLLDARMVAACLERARTGANPWTQALLNTVASITPEGPRQLVVRTRRLDDLLPARLRSVPIWVEAQRPGGPAVGTGPYRPRRWAQGGDVLLEAFGAYRAGPPPIPLVQYRVVPEATERARLLETGDADLMLDVPAERMQALAASPQLRTMAIDGMRVFFLTMDCSAEAGAATPPSPFRDRRVREAVALAIDRRALVAGPLGGFGEVIDQIASPQELGAAATVVPVRHVDRDRARALLAQAGYPSGLRVSLDYLRKYRAADAVTKSIADDLATVGIDVVRRPAARIDADRVRRHEVTFVFMGWTSQTGEAGWAYESFLHSQVGGYGNLNVSRYANPALDRLIEDALGQRGPTERAALLARVAQVAYDEVPMVPLYRQADLYAMARNLEFTPRLDRLILASAVRWRDGARPAHAQ